MACEISASHYWRAYIVYGELEKRYTWWGDIPYFRLKKDVFHFIEVRGGTNWVGSVGDITVTEGGVSVTESWSGGYEGWSYAKMAALSVARNMGYEIDLIEGVMGWRLPRRLLE